MGIRKRGGRWLVTVELGSDEHGVRRRKCVSCETEQDAKRVHANLTAEVLNGTYVEPSNETVADFLAEWLRHAGRGRSQRTVDAYRISVERHLVPALGRVRLCALRPLHVEGMMTAELEAGLAPSTVDKHFWTLHKALDRAVAWGRIPRNPADAVEKPGGREAAVRAFDVAEQAKLIGRAAGTWLYGPVVLALATGMRRGELCALRWRDVAEGVVTVRGSLEESSTGVSAGKAKTATSVRSLRIPEAAVAMLADERAKQRQLYAAVSTYRDHGYVFPREDGPVHAPAPMAREHTVSLP